MHPPPFIRDARRQARKRALLAVAIYTGATLALWLAMSLTERAHGQVLAIEAGQGVQLSDVRVIDGDTIEAGGVRYRLANIDAPEIGAPECLAERLLGQHATLALSALVHSADLVSVTPSGVDRYGRTLGQLWLDGYDAGATLIDMGLARPWEGRRVDWCAPEPRTNRAVTP